VHQWSSEGEGQSDRIAERTEFHRQDTKASRGTGPTADDADSRTMYDERCTSDDAGSQPRSYFGTNPGSSIRTCYAGSRGSCLGRNVWARFMGYRSSSPRRNRATNPARKSGSNIRIKSRDHP
jgi:hypothetical protein